MKRGICPVCDREYALTAQGGMRSHWAPREIRRTVGYDCKGIGQPPKWTVADPVTEAVEAAEARGYQRAIAVMRDDSAYWEHQRKTGEYDGGRRFIADWVESQAPAQTAIRSGESTDERS